MISTVDRVRDAGYEQQTYERQAHEQQAHEQQATSSDYEQ